MSAQKPGLIQRYGAWLLFGIGGIGTLVVLAFAIVGSNWQAGVTDEVRATDQLLRERFRGGMTRGTRIGIMHLSVWIGDPEFSDADIPRFMETIADWQGSEVSRFELDVSGTAITDEGLRQLATLQRLDLLNIAGTEISDAALAEFATQHSQVEISQD